MTHMLTSPTGISCAEAQASQRHKTPSSLQHAHQSAGIQTEASPIQQHGARPILPEQVLAVDQGDGHFSAVLCGGPQALRVVLALVKATQHRLHLLDLPAAQHSVSFSLLGSRHRQTAP